MTALADLDIREARDADRDGIWAIFKDVVAAGDTYPFDPAISREDALEAWVGLPKRTYVATQNAEILGTYYLKDNQTGLGAHVCNAGYMVKAGHRGRGLGRALCAHSLEAAKALRYRAMQYNLVVSTNHGAFNLWRSMGFETVGTLPDAFDHRILGLVDAYVMYRRL